MFCTQCGARLQENAYFCTHCGTKIKREDQALETEDNDTTGPSQPPETISTMQEHSHTDEDSSKVEGGTPQDCENQEDSMMEAQDGLENVTEAQSDGETPKNESPVDISSKEDLLEEEGTEENLAELQPNEGETAEEGATDLALLAEEPLEGTISKKSLKKWLMALLILVPLIIGAVVYYQASANWQYKEEMNAADHCLKEAQYADAEAHYREALNFKKGDIKASLGLGRVLLCQGKFDEAEKVLIGLTLSQQDSHYAEWQKLISIMRMNPEINQPNIKAFPMIQMTMTCAGLEITADNIKVKEGENDCTVEDFNAKDGILTFSYRAGDSGYSSEHRTISVRITVDGIPFERSVEYDTPTFEQAQLSLVSADMSQFPLVKAYFRVENPQTGDSITGLNEKAFFIRERMQGGDYLAREVRAAAPVEGKEGVNINLAADKSDSIAEEDMLKIKDVMRQFVQNLHFNKGDKAEILAFDSIVQQMCCFTNEEPLLVNGIENMSTDGQTALYDAIYVGINHAALQGGARCVIAFTDGQDNSSRHSVEELISYSKENQVPVYIIGVGSSVEESTLRNIADSTNGKYWFIDDLYDLEFIFDNIYKTQKQLYCIEYMSEEGKDPYLARDLDISMTGAGYKGTLQTSFQPARTINDNGGVALRKSRYEIFKEALTWDEAAQRCQEMGGHLATVSSSDEMNQLIKMADTKDVKYIWLGGYTSYDQSGNVFGHWVTGEEFGFSSWASGEPSRVDQDGTDEWYIMLWNVDSQGGWCWNDQRNDPRQAIKTMQDHMGFICEFEGMPQS